MGAAHQRAGEAGRGTSNRVIEISGVGEQADPGLIREMFLQTRRILSVNHRRDVRDRGAGTRPRGRPAAARGDVGGDARSWRSRPPRLSSRLHRRRRPDAVIRHLLADGLESGCCCSAPAWLPVSWARPAATSLITRLLLAGPSLLTANVTNLLAVLGSGWLGERARLDVDGWPLHAAWLPSMVSLAGALLLRTPTDVFDLVVPVLVATGSTILLLQPAISGWQERRLGCAPRRHRAHGAAVAPTTATSAPAPDPVHRAAHAHHRAGAAPGEQPEERDHRGGRRCPRSSSRLRHRRVVGGVAAGDRALAGRSCHPDRRTAYPNRRSCTLAACLLRSSPCLARREPLIGELVARRVIRARVGDGGDGVRRKSRDDDDHVGVRR